MGAGASAEGKQYVLMGIAESTFHVGMSAPGNCGSQPQHRQYPSPISAVIMISHGTRNAMRGDQVYKKKVSKAFQRMERLIKYCRNKLYQKLQCFQIDLNTFQHLIRNGLNQRLANFSMKGQTVNTSGFVAIRSLWKILQSALAEEKQPWTISTWRGIDVSQYNFIYRHLSLCLYDDHVSWNVIL